MYVKPADGLIVLGPDGVAVPPEGMEVDATAFWFRRLADGDVYRATPPAPGGGE